MITYTIYVSFVSRDSCSIIYIVTQANLSSKSKLGIILFTAVQAYNNLSSVVRKHRRFNIPHSLNDSVDV